MIKREGSFLKVNHMVEVFAEKLSTNDESIFIGEVYIASETEIRAGQIIMTIEGSKGTKDLYSETSGLVFIRVNEGQEVSIGSLLYIVFDNIDEFENYKLLHENKREQNSDVEYNVTEKARKLITEKKLDVDRIAKFTGKATITSKDVLSFIQRTEHSLIPRKANSSRFRYDLERVLVIGGGSAADVLINVISLSSDKLIWAVIDKNNPCTYPEVNTLTMDDEEFLRSFDKESFDSAIISIGDLGIRKKLFELYSSFGISFTNLIHPTALLEKGVNIGKGNFIDAHSRIGVFSTIGNNNWIAAKVNLDHHNALGDSSLLGPGVMTSGLVKIGSGSLVGAGTSIIPSVVIGDNCLVPAGSVIVNDISDGTRMKIKP